MKYKLSIFLVIFLSLFSLMAIKYVNADEDPLADYNAKTILNDTAGTNYDPGGKITNTNIEDNFYLIIGKIIEIALSIVGIVLLVLIIYAGYLWFGPQGNEDQITKAKQYLINSVIGLAIVLSAYTITWFIMLKISGAVVGI